ncbi:hypothetical protein QO001_003287 [Methylobacterium brachiatum]|jgi:hypothetical protein|uniref:Uncharacterized protein n=1 Tax=Methylobacterium brachiatum TaxID=269660 RepID=A0AAJ1TXH5_9HYPH|nr:hypothetical protein [Methylobacterium brachiatum]MCB4801444.1 hypothetical protein [Methylobacterium brachiatum]MDQ0544353.1 hypothetical protein [Methylobacterium brachiatum]
MAAAQSTELRSENTRGWPNWAKAARKALLISTALSVGAIGLTASLEKLGYNLQAACNAFTFCAAKAPPPQIPNFNSGFMPGGRTGTDFCIPLAQTWQNKYSDYNIHWTVLPEDIRRKGWGKVEYQYHCAFGATEKTSTSQVYMNRFLEFAATNYTATMTALLSVLALAILALRFGPRRVSATTA